MSSPRIDRSNEREDAQRGFAEKLSAAIGKRLGAALSVGNRGDPVVVKAVTESLAELGYRIEVSSSTGAVRENEDGLTNADGSRLAKASVEEVLQIVGSLVAAAQFDADFLAQAMQRLLDLGQPLAAYDLSSAMSAEIERAPSEQKRLVQLRTLALSRCGAVASAIEELEQLELQSSADEESLGLFGGTWKELWHRQKNRTGAARGSLKRALEAYRTAFEATGGYWTGINAATLSLASGDLEQATQLAGAVEKACQGAMEEDSKGDQYWPLATLGEAALILGDLARAKDCYQQALLCAPGDFGRIASTRRNAQLILQAAERDPSMVNELLPSSTVAVFSGHMMDAPKRSHPRFPAASAEAVRHALEQLLERHQVAWGYSSAACGGDLLFQQALAARGAESHIVLPIEEKAFLESSVRVGGQQWEKSFTLALQRAVEVHHVPRSGLTDDGRSFDYANRLMQGLAQLQATLLSTEVVFLSVWDRAGARGLGGTAQTVDSWLDAGRPVDVIDPLTGSIETVPGRDQARVPGRPAGPNGWPESTVTEEPSTELVSLLFADAVGFSNLRDEQIESFVEAFLGRLRAVLDEGPAATHIETAGDGVYLVFAGNLRDSVRHAGETALALTKAVSEMNWVEHGLPAETGLRVAVHCGPVRRFANPLVAGTSWFSGVHTSHAARLEARTPPNQVYATREFAALASNEGVDTFAWEYVGRIEWAKQHGLYPTYHLRDLG